MAFRLALLGVAVVIAAGGCLGVEGARPPAAPTGESQAPAASSSAAASGPAATGSAVSPAPGTSGSGGPSPSASPSPQAALTKFGYREKGMTHEVIAFINHGHLDEELPKIDFGAVSTIAYFSIGVTSSGRIDRSRSDWRRWMGRTMDTLIARAHAAGVKVVPSIQRFAWTKAGQDATVKLLSRPAARQRAAREIAALVHDRGVDGVNIDVEPIPRSQRTNFVRFVREVRKALDAKRRGYQLTYCTTGLIGNYDVKSLAKPGAADAVYIMGYQYRGSFSQYAGSVAPLGGPTYDYTETLRRFLKETTRDKIILGVPLFGWSWNTRTSGVRSRITGGSRALFYRQARLEAARRPFRYDKTENVAWTAFKDGGGWRQMYFDNVRALEAKWNFIIRNKLKGTGLWALGFEGGGSKEIFALLRKKFVRATN